MRKHRKPQNPPKKPLSSRIDEPKTNSDDRRRRRKSSNILNKEKIKNFVPRNVDCEKEHQLKKSPTSKLKGMNSYLTHLDFVESANNQEDSIHQDLWRCRKSEALEKKSINLTALGIGMGDSQINPPKKGKSFSLTTIEPWSTTRGISRSKTLRRVTSTTATQNPSRAASAC